MIHRRFLRGLAAALLVSGCSAAPAEEACPATETYQWPDSSPAVSPVQPTSPDKPANVNPGGTLGADAGAVPIPVPRAGGLRRR